jgi:hypothetical protein
MSDSTAPHAEALLDRRRERWRLALLAGAAYAGGMGLLAALQFAGFKWVFAPEALPVNQDLVRLFIFVNFYSAASTGLVTLALYILGRRRPALRDRLYPVIAHLVALSAIPFALMHIHFAGSLNTVLVMGLPTIALAFYWLLSPRAAWFYFVLGTLSLWTLQALEYYGALPYAPLLQYGPELGRRFLHDYYFIQNGLIYLVLSLFMLAALRLFDRETERRRRAAVDVYRQLLNRERELNRLRGLLPICAHCHKVRDDEGYWRDVSQYIQDHSAAQVSHGICPDCLRKEYPDLCAGATEKEKR